MQAPTANRNHAIEPAGGIPSPAMLRRVALASCIGSTVEWYEFLHLCHGLCPGVQQAVLSRGSARWSVPLSRSARTATGFIARPIGGLVFGIIGDRKGTEVRARRDPADGRCRDISGRAPAHLRDDRLGRRGRARRRAADPRLRDWRRAGQRDPHHLRACAAAGARFLRLARAVGRAGWIRAAARHLRGAHPVAGGCLPELGLANTVSAQRGSRRDRHVYPPATIGIAAVQAAARPPRDEPAWPDAEGSYALRPTRHRRQAARNRRCSPPTLSSSRPTPSAKAFRAR